MKLFSFNIPEVEASFWDHLETLRWTFIRVLLVVVSIVVVMFSFKDFIFDEIIFTPVNSDFITYRLLCKLALWLNAPGFCPDAFDIKLINFEISGQFIAHLTTTLTIALIITVPYILYEIWRFIAPALYPNERKSAGMVFFTSSFLFYLGSAVSFYLIFPLTIRFLGTYQISSVVPNQISLQSYLSTLFILVFAMGLMFEMPVLAYFLSRLGILSRQTLKAVRNYAIVVILILSAFITPTTDPFTMLVVALPLYLLYEVSILVSKPKMEEIED